MAGSIATATLTIPSSVVGELFEGALIIIEEFLEGSLQDTFVSYFISSESNFISLIGGAEVLLAPDGSLIISLSGMADRTYKCVYVPGPQLEN